MVKGRFYLLIEPIVMVKRLKLNFVGANAEAIAFPVPIVQNKQDCPEDSGHWELRGSDRPFGQLPALGRVVHVGEG